MSSRTLLAIGCLQFLFVPRPARCPFISNEPSHNNIAVKVINCYCSHAHFYSLLKRLSQITPVLLDPTNAMPSGVPSLASLDHQFLSYDREWKQHRLPNEDISVPRDHLPDPEAESIPSAKHVSFQKQSFPISIRKELASEIERRWNDTGLNRIYMGPSQSGADTENA